jgi:hypothetical protein
MEMSKKLSGEENLINVTYGFLVIEMKRGE